MRRPARWLQAAALAALLAGAAAAGQPEAPGAAGGEPAEPAEEFRARREAVAQELAELDRRVVVVTPEQPSGQVAAERELLEGIDRAYARVLEELERARDVARNRQALDERLVAGPRGEIAQAPPFSLALLDAALDARDAQAERTRAVRAALAAAEGALAQASQDYETAEARRRLAREEAEQEKGQQEAARLRAALRLAQLQSRAAEARRELALLEVENARAELANQEPIGELLEDAVAWVRAGLELEGSELREPLARLAEEDFELARQLERANRELETAGRRLDLAERRLESSDAPPPELVAEVDARRLERQLLQRRAAFLGERTRQVAAARELWERRFRVLAGQAGRSELAAWEKEIGQALEDAERARRLARARLAEVQQELEAARARADASAAAQLPRARWEAEQVRSLESFGRLHEEELAALGASSGLAERTLGDIRSRTARTTLGDRLQGIAGRAQEAWRVELFAVDDRSITVGKISGAILIFVLGFAAALGGSRLLGRALRRRLDAGGASAIQGLTFYVLVALVFLLALRTVNIPLTAFAVLGGALAIGIGFGSQNVVNNFISGLILMAERPIKVGDLIELDGTWGHVERIGPRSTRIRTFDNIHLIVPNSAFLEKDVVNWTLSDDDIRAVIDVGVVYGSPTREVARLLRKAMDEHGQVMAKPEPSVWFTGFGESALEFKALFWIRSRDMVERRRIESDVRYRIDNLFREAGIVMAFPQRDVHLDTSRPLEVRVLPPEA